jgi:hypothetical protein
MCKRIILSFLVLSSCCHAFGQKTNELLTNNWICTKVEDITGNPTSCTFGDSYEYLRFEFTNRSITISEAPFDRGLTMPFSMNGNEIEVFSEELFHLPELNFNIRRLTNDSLILYANTKEHEAVYYFLNLKKTRTVKSESNQLVDCGLTILNESYIATGELPLYSYKNFDYRILFNESALLPSPSYYNSSHMNFGSFLALNFKFPKEFQNDKLTEEIIIDLLVSKNGFSGVKIVKGINYELNSAIFDLLIKTNKSWIPVKNKSIASTTLRFHFKFLKTTIK